MNIHDFSALTARQRHTLVLAMQVRNWLEDFHVANLSDAQMKVLNQRTRYAIYAAVELIETMQGDPKKEAFYSYLVEMIPDYWEIPGRDPDPTGAPKG